MKLSLLALVLSFQVFAAADDCSKDGWCPLEIGPPRIGYETIQNVFANTPEDVWVFGRTYLYRYHGKCWLEKKIDARRPWIEPYAVARAGSSFVRAEFSNDMRSIEITTYIERENFWHSIGTLPVSGNAIFASVWASSEKDIYLAVEGQVNHYNGKEWTDLTKTRDIKANLVYGSAADNVWLVGKNYVTQLNDDKVTRFELDDAKYLTSGLYAVWTDKAGHGFVAGGWQDFDTRESDSVVYEVNQGIVKKHNLKTTQTIAKLTGDKWGNVYAVGGSITQYVGPGILDEKTIMSYGYLTKFDGQRWTEEDTGIKEGEPLHDISVADDGEVWAMSNQRLIRKAPWPRAFPPLEPPGPNAPPR
jgi:hypothetical protein